MKILHELFKICISLMIVSILVICGAMILVAFGVDVDARLIMIAGIIIALSFLGALAIVQAENDKLNGD